MENMDGTVLATSLPAIAADLHQDPIVLKLALTSYLLTLAVFIPASGWIADNVGLFGSTGVSIAANGAGTSTLWGSPSFQKWARNGAALANSSGAVALPWPWATMYATASPVFGTQWCIGNDRTLALRGWSGPISEFLMFPAALSAADRLSIERSQGAYFGVSVP